MRKGTKHTKETRERIRIAMARPEVKRKMIDNHADFNREKNPFWGRKHSCEAKEKFRERTSWNKGIPMPDWIKEKIREGNRGRIFTGEHRRKISENHADVCGKNNPAWKGGLSFEPYGIEFNDDFKNKIRKRDKYLCQFCGQGKNGRRLCVHHINYEKVDGEPRNLISLCLPCHAKTDFNRSKWQFLFEVIQELRFTKWQ